MSEKELLPIGGAFQEVKFTPATFEYPQGMFESIDAKLCSQCEGVSTEYEGQWKAEISNLKQFIDNGKAYLKGTEAQLMADFKPFSDRAKRTLKLAESLRDALKNDNDTFVMARRNDKVAEVMDYIQSENWGEDMDTNLFVIPDWFYNLTTPFADKKAELQRQAKEITAVTVKNREDILAAQKKEKEQALNYEFIIKEVNDLNKEYGTNIAASEFVGLKDMHPMEAKAEVAKYFEFLAKPRETPPLVAMSHIPPTAAPMPVGELMGRAKIVIVLKGNDKNLQPALDELKKFIEKRLEGIQEEYGLNATFFYE